MVGRDDEIQNGQPVTLFGFIQQLNPAIAVFGELKKKLPLVTLVGQMPDMTGNKMSVCACH